MTRALFTALSLSLVTAAAGCISHERGDDAGAGDAGPGEPWRDCACGIPDAPPPPDAFDPVCGREDARGEGACRAVLGYAWHDGNCWSVTGCECVGADCGSLAPTPEACIAAHASCERICGGFAEVNACLPTEYCDYPDGSFCGGDDSTGLCTARPTDCLEPGGVTVCGCDGNEYIGECSAYFSGIDIARIGPCVTSSAYRTAKADRDCGPADGPAWTITLTTSRESCDLAATDGSIGFSLWHALESATPGTTYRISTDLSGDGSASVCGRMGEPCAQATGTVTVHAFVPGETGTFDYDLTTTDGRRFAETGIQIAPFWCRLDFIGCG